MADAPPDAPRPLPVDPPLPGVAAPSAELAAELERAVGERGPGYRPRTRHVLDDGRPRYTNRLARERSPYLLQHAHNPVNWFPWGDEAFARARSERKLVLLSVGYSTCHWCHVMEHESFEDEAIAALLNEKVVAVKVDREERPDVDAVYMTTVQMMSGHGGWPMTVFLTPDREPIFGGTYFPPRDGARGARVGFVTIVEELARRYAEDPAGIASQARRFTEHLRQYLAAEPSSGVPGPEAIRAAAGKLAEGFDPEHGGFGGAPKFPRPAALMLLARYARRTGDEAARHMVERTLESMASGGIRDHVGGGFHRYAVDEWWLVPHFEKMLYDNAQLAIAYVEGAQLCGRADFAAVARETLTYLRRELRAPHGGFWSATDADSPGPDGRAEEGLFFTWTPEELDAALGPELGRRAAAYWGVTRHGNSEGRTVLNVQRPVAVVAAGLGVAPAELTADLERARAMLYEARSRRAPPITDTKVVTAWNGLALAAFARVGFALADETFVDEAREVARFLVEQAREGGRLCRVVADGVATGEGFLDDYAFVVAGLLDLYEATGEVLWLREALALQRMQQDEMWDAEQGAYFFTSVRHEALLARDKPDYDGAEPSGNSVAILSLLRLAEWTGRDDLRGLAGSALAAFGRALEQRPLALPYMLSALDFWHDRPPEVVVVAPPDGEGLEAMLAPVRETFLPNRVLSVAREGDDLAAQAALVPLLADRRPEHGRATAFVCRAQACELPTTDPAALAEALARVEPLGDVAPPGPGAAAPEAWAYDADHDRHWDPVRRAWAPGRHPE